MAVYNGPKITTSGLVLNLDAADRNSYVSGSTVWRDVSGGGYTANITSPVYTTEGGGGFTSGTTSVPAVTQANPTQLSLEVTLRIVTTTAFVFYGEYGSSSPAYDNKITFRGSNSGNGLQILFYGNTTTGQTLTSVGNFNVSTTKIIAVTFDSSGVARLYINGSFAGSTTVTNFTSWQVSTNQGVLIANYYSNLKVYNRALSAEEVLQNYNATKTRFGL